jgi:hypothetical protein
VLDHPKTLEQPDVRKAWEDSRKQGADGLLDSLGLVGRLDYGKERYAAVMDEIRALLLDGMRHGEERVRTVSLSTLRTIEPLQSDEQVLGGLDRLAEDGSADVRNSARTLQASFDARGGRGGFNARQLLDYEFFKVNVQPILADKGRDGLACVNCHANHTIFKLVEPDEYGVLSEADIRQNYAAALGVTNVSDPEGSLLLNKPISDEDSAGIGQSQRFSHGGDLRWPDRRNSREYRVLLRWIQGERLGSAAEERASE